MAAACPQGVAPTPCETPPQPASERRHSEEGAGWPPAPLPLPRGSSRPVSLLTAHSGCAEGLRGSPSSDSEQLFYLGGLGAGRSWAETPEGRPGTGAGSSLSCYLCGQASQSLCRQRRAAGRARSRLAARRPVQ